VRFDRKNELSVANFDQFDGCRDLKTRRRGGFVTDIDVSTNRLLFRPVEVGVNCFYAGPLSSTKTRSISRFGLNQIQNSKSAKGAQSEI